MKSATSIPFDTQQILQVNRVLNINIHKNGTTVRPEALSKYHVSVCTEKSELLELMDAWGDLAERSGQSIYMSPEWILSWWNHFGENKDRRLHVVTIKAADKLVGILPFYKGRSRFGKRVVEERLQLIGSGGNANEQIGFSDDYGISDFLDFIVDPAFNEPVSELIQSLLETPEFATYPITLHQLREDSFINQHLLPLLNASERTIKVETTDTCPVIELNGTPSLDTYVKKQKSNARRRLRKARVETDTQAHFRMESAETVDTLDFMLDDLIRLHQERWNQLGYPGVFYDPRFRSFFIDITHRLYRKHQVWIKQARDEHGVAAIRMAILYNNRYFDYMSGFDSNSPSTKYRPGISLLLDMVNDSLKNSVERIELLRGEEGYKYDFTQRTIANRKISISPSTSSSTARHILVTTLHGISRVYSHVHKERILMDVQHKNSGLSGMLQGYLKFRYQSLRNKLNRKNGS